MKPFLKIVVMIAFAYQAKAQLINDENRILIGTEICNYENSYFGASVKYIRHEKISGTLKINPFSYEHGYSSNLSEGYHYNNVYNNSLSVNHAVNGITIKPGISFLNTISDNYILNWSQSLVITQAHHNLIIAYMDAMGYSEQNHLKTSLTFGFESDFTYQLKLLNYVYLSLSTKLGYKPTAIKLYDDVIKGYPTYYNYTPSQGRGTTPFYMLLSFGFGIVL